MGSSFFRYYDYKTPPGLVVVKKIMNTDGRRRRPFDNDWPHGPRQIMELKEMYFSKKIIKDEEICLSNAKCY